MLSGEKGSAAEDDRGEDSFGMENDGRETSPQRQLALDIPHSFIAGQNSNGSADGWVMYPASPNGSADGRVMYPVSSKFSNEKQLPSGKRESLIGRSVGRSTDQNGQVGT